MLLVEISMLFMKSCQLVLKKLALKKFFKKAANGIILLRLEESLRALHASG